MGLHSEWGAARFVFTTTYPTKENSESGNLALNMTTKETTGRILCARSQRRKTTESGLSCRKRANQ